MSNRTATSRSGIADDTLGKCKQPVRAFEETNSALVRCKERRRPLWDFVPARDSNLEPSQSAYNVATHLTPCTSVSSFLSIPSFLLVGRLGEGLFCGFRNFVVTLPTLTLKGNGLCCNRGAPVRNHLVQRDILGGPAPIDFE